MNDTFEVKLQDVELNAEIRLLTDLMVAATGCDAPLSQPAIDEILFATTHEETPQSQPRAEGAVPEPRSS